MVHEDFMYLPRRTTSDKVLRHKVFNIAKIQNMIDIWEVLLQWFVIFFYKKSSINTSGDTDKG